MDNRQIVKTTNFKDKVYIGDPINTVHIFNQKEIDEIIFLDINKSKSATKPDFDLIKDLASECFMPISYGGGVNSIEDMKTIFSFGVEKNNFEFKFY